MPHRLGWAKAHILRLYRLTLRLRLGGGVGVGAGGSNEIIYSSISRKKEKRNENLFKTRNDNYWGDRQRIGICWS